MPVQNKNPIQLKTIPNMDFSIRSNKKELLDQPGIPAADIERNMLELAIINNQLGGHAITRKGFTRLAKKRKEMHICEIGCGGGDNLKALEKNANGENAGLSFTGIDINPDCIQFAKKYDWKVPVKFVASDYKNVEFSSKPDILFCSLFCHHFNFPELISMIKWMKQNSRIGFFINDLHRHPLAYHSIRFLTSVFSRSYLVKNDAPLSVLRGFKRKELQDMLHRAEIRNYTIQWNWAFRWLIVVYQE
jgi:2-polyprenyl-3-methyl-5-hydroxy-6-metoxy-1,4-benzoquinol methylase